MPDLGKGGKGGVKTIRGFWLDHSVVEARVDWVPGVWIEYLGHGLGAWSKTHIINGDCDDADYGEDDTVDDREEDDTGDGNDRDDTGDDNDGNDHDATGDEEKDDDE